MRRQRRLDVLFVLVLIAAAMLVSVVYVRKAMDCADRGGRLIVVGRTIECRRGDGTTIPI